MARIRSIHPSFFTDEGILGLNFAARMIYLGLLTEADDHGIFAWKPLTLKARLAPVDPIDLEGILKQLVEAGFVRGFSAEDKRFGAIKNFARYQRPKKPSYVHPLPTELESFVTGRPVALTAHDEVRDARNPDCSLVPEPSGIRAVPHGYETGSELRPQREEEGGRMKEEKGRRKSIKSNQTATTTVIDPVISPVTLSISDADRATSDLIDAAVASLAAVLGRKRNDRMIKGSEGLVAQWLVNGWDLDLDILPTVAAVAMEAKARGNPPKALSYFTAAIERAHAARLAAARPPRKGQRKDSSQPVDLPNPWPGLVREGYRSSDEKHLHLLCRRWHRDKDWPDDFGPRPGEAGSFVPETVWAGWLRCNSVLPRTVAAGASIRPDTANPEG